MDELDLGGGGGGRSLRILPRQRDVPTCRKAQKRHLKMMLPLFLIDKVNIPPLVLIVSFNKSDV